MIYAIGFLIIVFLLIKYILSRQQSRFNKKLEDGSFTDNYNPYIIDYYLDAKDKKDKNLSVAISLFLYFKSIYPDYHLIFPTIMRLLYPLPKEFIFDAINFVSQNVHKFPKNKNTISLQKLAQFSLFIRQKTQATYGHQLGEDSSYHMENTSSLKNTQRSDYNLTEEEKIESGLKSLQIPIKKIGKKDEEIFHINSHNQTASPLLKKGNKNSSPQFLMIDNLLKAFSDSKISLDLREKLQKKKLNISRNYKLLQSHNNNLNTSNHLIVDTDSIRSSLANYDSNQYKQLGYQELWHFLVDFEKYLIKNNQYDELCQDFNAKLFLKNSEQLINLLQTKAQILIFFMKNMFMFNFQSIIKKNYIKLVEDYEKRIRIVQMSVIKRQVTTTSNPFSANLSSIQHNSIFQIGNNLNFRQFDNNRGGDDIFINIEEWSQPKSFKQQIMYEKVNSITKSKTIQDKSQSILIPEQLEPVQEHDEDEDSEHTFRNKQQKIKRQNGGKRVLNSQIYNEPTFRQQVRKCKDIDEMSIEEENEKCFYTENKEENEKNDLNYNQLITNEMTQNSIRTLKNQDKEVVKDIVVTKEISISSSSSSQSSSSSDDDLAEKQHKGNKKRHHSSKSNDLSKDTAKFNENSMNQYNNDKQRLVEIHHHYYYNQNGLPIQDQNLVHKNLKEIQKEYKHKHTVELPQPDKLSIIDNSKNSLGFDLKKLNTALLSEKNKIITTQSFQEAKQKAKKQYTVNTRYSKENSSSKVDVFVEKEQDYQTVMTTQNGAENSPLEKKDDQFEHKQEQDRQDRKDIKEIIILQQQRNSQIKDNEKNIFETQENIQHSDKAFKQENSIIDEDDGQSDEDSFSKSSSNSSQNKVIEIPLKQSQKLSFKQLQDIAVTQMQESQISLKQSTSFQMKNEEKNVQKQKSSIINTLQTNSNVENNLSRSHQKLDLTPQFLQEQYQHQKDFSSAHQNTQPLNSLNVSQDQNNLNFYLPDKNQQNVPRSHHSSQQQVAEIIPPKNNSIALRRESNALNSQQQQNSPSKNTQKKSQFQHVNSPSRFQQILDKVDPESKQIEGFKSDSQSDQVSQDGSKKGSLDVQKLIETKRQEQQKFQSMIDQPPSIKVTKPSQIIIQNQKFNSMQEQLGLISSQNTNLIPIIQEKRNDHKQSLFKQLQIFDENLLSAEDVSSFQSSIQSLNDLKEENDQNQNYENDLKANPLDKVSMNVQEVDQIQQDKIEQIKSEEVIPKSSIQSKKQSIVKPLDLSMLSKKIDIQENQSSLMDFKEQSKQSLLNLNPSNELEDEIMKNFKPSAIIYDEQMDQILAQLPQEGQFQKKKESNKTTLRQENPQSQVQEKLKQSMCIQTQEIEVSKSSEDSFHAKKSQKKIKSKKNKIQQNKKQKKPQKKKEEILESDSILDESESQKQIKIKAKRVKQRKTFESESNDSSQLLSESIDSSLDLKQTKKSKKNFTKKTTSKSQKKQRSQKQIAAEGEESESKNEDNDLDTKRIPTFNKMDSRKRELGRLNSKIKFAQDYESNKKLDREKSLPIQDDKRLNCKVQPSRNYSRMSQPDNEIDDADDYNYQDRSFRNNFGNKTQGSKRIIMQRRGSKTERSFSQDNDKRRAGDSNQIRRLNSLESQSQKSDRNEQNIRRLQSNTSAANDYGKSNTQRRNSRNKQRQLASIEQTYLMRQNTNRMDQDNYEEDQLRHDKGFEGGNSSIDNIQSSARPNFHQSNSIRKPIERTRSQMDSYRQPQNSSRRDFSAPRSAMNLGKYVEVIQEPVKKSIFQDPDDILYYAFEHYFQK